MKIIGRGLIASAILPYQHEHDDTVIFASGVSDSTTQNPVEFEREYHLLYDTLRSALPDYKRIVYFSSGGAIYGQFNGKRSENTPLFPMSAYGRHKLLCEAIVRQSTLPYLILRLPNLVGARPNKAQLIPALIQQIRQDKVTLFQHATRDLLDVEDLITILRGLLALKLSNETLVVASGTSIPVVKIYDAIQEVLKTQVKPEYIPRGGSQQFSINKLQHLIKGELPFHPEYYQDIIRKYAASIAGLLP